MEGSPPQAPAFLPALAACAAACASASFLALSSFAARSGSVMRLNARPTLVPLSMTSRGSLRSLQQRANPCFYHPKTPCKGCKTTARLMSVPSQPAKESDFREHHAVCMDPACRHVMQHCLPATKHVRWFANKEYA